MKVPELTLDDVRGRATITVEEAARLLGVSRGVGYEGARNGQLPVLHIGRRVLVSVPRLLALIEMGQQEVAS